MTTLSINYIASCDEDYDIGQISISKDAILNDVST